MKTNDFPCVYNIYIDQQTNNQINAERQNLYSVKNQIAKGKTEKPKFGSATSAGASAGFSIGFIVCVIMCIKTDDFYNDVGPLVAGVVILIACIVFGFFADLFAIGAHESSIRTADSKTEFEQNQSEERINTWLAEAERKKTAYSDWFEQTVKQNSVRFATSNQAQVIIQWMLDGFFYTIDHADRRSHIKRIVVPFSYDVYQDKIVCNLGVFDFELERCSKLKSAVEQAALARAIASDLHLKAEMKYPNDISGNRISIRMEHQYYNDHVQYTVVYEADNGYFIEETGW